MTLAIPPDPMSQVLADLARVTAERDAAFRAVEAAHAQLAAANARNADAHDQRVAALRAERDALSAALATLWEAGRACCAADPPNRSALYAAVHAASSPAEHGERVLREAEERGYDRGRNDQLEANEVRTREAEERGRAAVLADERTAMELGEALAARMAELKFGPRTIEQWTGVADDALAVVRGRVRTARKEGTR